MTTANIETTLFNPVYQHLSSLLLQALDHALPGHGMEQEKIYRLLTPAPNLDLGHFAFPCFPLAKALKMAPPHICGQLASALESQREQNRLSLSAVKAAGPYLNLTVSPQFLGEHSLQAMLTGEHFTKPLIRGQQKWMIEYSQPNSHKELHVGHMRNLCLGHALTSMAKYAGINTSPVTYPGDVGTHVAKCLWYFKKHYQGDVPAGTPAEKGAWLGTLYTLGNNLLEDQRGSELEEQNRQELTAILHELHDQKGPYYELWRETRQWSIALMEQTYQWADVSFDRWFWESEMDAPSLAFAKELYDRGQLIKDDGAIGMDLSEDKLGFCLMIKRDGTGLYATKDVELARRKFEEFGVDRNIYVVDNRQAHHFKQVFKVLERIGFDKAKQCYHLPYAMVELPDGAMSSRKGNIVPLMDLIHHMQELIKSQYLQKYLDDPNSGWNEEQVEQTAQSIAGAAIKYGMIRVDNNRSIVFKMEDWLKLDGETGPYLQYVNARILSLEEKLGPLHSEIQWSLLNKKQELALMLKLVEFNNVVALSVQKMQTVTLCSYLFELGKLFNSFYAECPLAKAGSEELKQARLAVAVATGNVMSTGLSLLGIAAPTKM